MKVPQLRAALVVAGNALTCAGCGQRYPAAEQLPILVAEPAAYVRGELALLTRAIAGARQRLRSLEEIARAARQLSRVSASPPDNRRCIVR